MVGAVVAGALVDYCSRLCYHAFCIAPAHWAQIVLVGIVEALEGIVLLSAGRTSIGIDRHLKYTSDLFAYQSLGVILHLSGQRVVGYLHR